MMTITVGSNATASGLPPSVQSLLGLANFLT